MWNVMWVVKASKLCNLRCRYCYEWDDLANPSRISTEQWAKILTAVRRYHESQEQRYEGKYKSAIVWHGGEPLLLPRGYFEEVIRLQHELLGTTTLKRREFVNYLQTNLYSLEEAKLNLLYREGFEFGVSFDVMRGVRLRHGGEESEESVLSNLERLRRRGARVRGCVVLARHTHAHLKDIYDFYESLALPFSVFPLSQAPLHARIDFSITEREMTNALGGLFEYWMERSGSLEIEPLRTCLQTVVMHMAGLARLPYDRREWGDRAFVVDTDGSLYSVADRYAPGRSLGNIFAQTMDEILVSPRYLQSLERDDAVRSQRCNTCEFRGACDTYPALSTQEAPHGLRCRTTYDLQVLMGRYLAHHGFVPSDLLEKALTGDSRNCLSIDE